MKAADVREFGGFRLDPVHRVLHNQDGAQIDLTVKVFDTLLYLVEHAGEVVEKSALMRAVWPNVVVEENNLNQAISVLRRGLGERAGEHRFIVTVPGRGFRFVAPVRVVQHDENATPVPARAGAGMLTADSPRLAIMPFENLSPDPAHAFFADGLHDEILATLAQRAHGLQVISRTTMMHYRTHSAPLARIAAELGAGYVVEGTVRREADQVRVTLKLIDARDERNLWTQSYDRTLKSALTLQCEVASDVASRLAARFVGGIAAPPTKDPRAYDLYLRSRLLGQLISPISPAERFNEVVRLVDSAIELDPNFAAAYAHRAGFSCAIFGSNHDNSDELLARMRDDLATAKRLAPLDPLVLATEALLLGWIECNLHESLMAFQSVERTGLADPIMLASYATLAARLGLTDEVVRLTGRALALDPANPFLLGVSAVHLSTVHRLDEALRVADRAIAVYPDRPYTRLVREEIIFNQTGRSAGLRQALAFAASFESSLSLLDLNFRVLTSEQAYDELQQLLDAVPDREIRCVPGPGGAGPAFSVGSRPMAQLRGLLALLRGDRAQAAEHGADVLDFVAGRKISMQNAWFLHLLSADGHTLLGQHEPAIRAARAAVAARPMARDTFGYLPALSAARTLAWCGAADEAIDLLEEMVKLRAHPGLACIVRNPGLAMPLEGNRRFESLISRLEAEMESITLE